MLKDTAANERDQARHGEGPVEDKHGVQALLTHEVTARKEVVSLESTGWTREQQSMGGGGETGHHDPPEQPGVSSQPGDGDANVVVNMEDLLLVRGQFRLGSLHKHTTSRRFVSRQLPRKTHV